MYSRSSLGLLLTFSETGAEITVNQTGSKFLCLFFQRSFFSNS